MGTGPLGTNLITKVHKHTCYILENLSGIKNSNSLKLRSTNEFNKFIQKLQITAKMRKIFLTLNRHCTLMRMTIMLNGIKAKFTRQIQ